MRQRYSEIGLNHHQYLLFFRSKLLLLQLCNVGSGTVYISYNIRLSEKFLSFYKEIIHAQCVLFYISLLNYTQT